MDTVLRGATCLMSPCRVSGQAMEVRIEGEHGELWYHVSNTTTFKTEPVGTIILLHGEGTSSNYFAFLFKRLSKRNVRVRDAHDARCCLRQE